MSELDTVQVIALVGWLVLAGGALAAYRLSWRSGLKLALVWASIFTAIYLLFRLVGV